ncbi:RHS repeat-associated core domain-containing protein (plasmid) [Pantoea agglomerans]|uniref:RHS repeat-associated core domain-containing protein n=1 Tax=Enterobacter agglomerans TaxID=549 RepID=UPI002ED4AA2F|nr:RHS repeat-associated core domain-containing protein [Pantoea agglomerans]
MHNTYYAMRFIRHGHACLGVAGPDGLTLTAGGHSDSTLWSRNTASPDGHLHTWSPWGAGDTTGGLPGFNGERPDPVSGSYHLGNGYRTYSPALRRFTCPDSLSPFGAGGINPYAYCAGDPVSRTDPTGHISWQGIVGIVGGIVGLGLSFIGGYMAIAAAEGIAAAVSSASATSLVVGGLGVAADVTAIASGATEDVNPAASSVLGWVSMATGIAGMISGAGAVGIRRMERAAAGAPWRTPEGRIGIEMSGRGAPVAGRIWARNLNIAEEHLAREMMRTGIYRNHPNIRGNAVLSLSENGLYTSSYRNRAILDIDNIAYEAEAIFDSNRVRSRLGLERLAARLNAERAERLAAAEREINDYPPAYPTSKIAPPIYESGELEWINPPPYSVARLKPEFSPIQWQHHNDV